MATTSTSRNKPTVVIVGAGAAGIFTAYQINTQWPGQFDVQLFEAAPKIGGNVSTLTVQYGGQTYSIDAGAQFFYTKAQPNYVNLIQALGMGGQMQLYPAGVTIWESSTNERLFWIPAQASGFLRYSLEDWTRIVEFGVFLAAAVALNDIGQPDWTLSVDDWLSQLPLSTDFKQNVIKNFLYQFVSMPYARIGEASAVYATTYFIRNVVGGSSISTPRTQGLLDLPTFQTDQNLDSLLAVLEKALAVTGVSAQVNSPVTAVAPTANGVTVTVNDKPVNAQYVVMACDPGTSATLLAAGGSANPTLVTLLKGLGAQYLDLSIVMQQNGSCWMPGDTNYWEAVSTLVNTPQQTVSFNGWFGPLRPPYNTNQQIPVFKSWGAPNLQSAGCTAAFFSHVHSVLLPTTSFMQLRSQLPAYQNQNGLFFAGGWTTWFDSQEAALMSAMAIAQDLKPSSRTAALSPSAQAYDPRVLPGQVKGWLEQVLHHAPEPHKSSLITVVKQLS